MSIRDDELDRLFRAANPAPAKDFEALRAKDIALRENIIRGRVAPRRRPAPRRSRTWAGAATAVAGVAVAAVVAVNVFSPTQQAVAELTPPRLEYAEAGSLSEVVEDAQNALRTPGGPEQESHVEYLTWGWSIDMATEHIEVVPQEIASDWTPGGGAVTTITAGESYWEENNRPAGVAPSQYEPGEVISRTEMSAAEVNAPEALITLEGSSEDDLAPALQAFGADEDASSGQVLVSIGHLFSYWTLTDAQHATLIDMLVDAGGVSVLGQTTDRIDREVIGLRVTDETTPYLDTVLISKETGRIVGMENELTAPQDFIPAGVVGYTLWEDE
ncbi:MULTISPECIES: hypothetical protein [unclassified Microbacterium]|uniref:hypothetical protein n=1 Tax=unclassified Microbacterium TaxID=2609290 RepID=UPI000EAAAAAF|nr:MULTISPECIES: hypothetical protein [unclassified Microbacterium]MBT2484097.1 hypothetical protein [Microbacterium sp. ISL-108]RKN67045.1 hypothetical protein D7252_05235 [Microbacterium sp. CGR2]